MAEITAAHVKARREKTGLPLMDCKKALNACDGNEDEAIRWLRGEPIDRSVIREQVEMGVAVRMACIDLLTRGIVGNAP